MNSRVNLTQDEFERVVREYCPQIRLQFGWIVWSPLTKKSGLSFRCRIQNINCAAYHNDRFIGAMPCGEFYLLDRFMNDNNTIKQLGLLNTAKRLSQFMPLTKTGIHSFEHLLDGLKIHGWHRAMLLTSITRQYVYGINRKEFAEYEPYYTKEIGEGLKILDDNKKVILSYTQSTTPPKA